MVAAWTLLLIVSQPPTVTYSSSSLTYLLTSGCASPEYVQDSLVRL